MARSHGPGLVIVCLALLAAAASATQFRVGGQRGWSVPGAGSEPYNAWAGRLRFQIGDQLLFVYPNETDSVLLVEPAAYGACNTSSYVRKFDDGATVFTFDRSGPFFFISGNEANCRADEKLVVVVLADRTGTRTPPPPSAMPPPSPAPLPSPSSPPSAAPMASPPSASPLPAPAATPSSAPSPAGSAPAPAPTTTTTPSSPPSPAGSAPAPAPTTTTTPSSPPSPAALAPSPVALPSTPGSVPQPPAQGNAPGADGGNATTPPPPSASDRSSASTAAAAGFVWSLGAYMGYAMLAI